MKEFNKWLNNIGYSDDEIKTLSRTHLDILEAEYTTLMMEANLK